MIDKHDGLRLIGAMLRCFAALAVLSNSALSAAAMVGGAPAVDASAYRSEVMILSSRGNLCTGIVLKQDAGAHGRALHRAWPCL